MARSLQFSRSGGDGEAAKFNQRLVEKLKYCKEVLVSIRSASAEGSETGTLGSGEGVGPGVGPSRPGVR